MIKPKLAKLFTFHPEYAHMKIAKQLAAKLFPPGFHFFPDNPKKKKTLEFYEFVLVDTGSIPLSHTPCKYKENRIAYSKC